MSQNQSPQFFDLSQNIELDLQNGGKVIKKLTEKLPTTKEKIQMIQTYLSPYNINTYQTVINGLLNEIIFEEDLRLVTCFQILDSINIDNFLYLLKKILQILEFTKLPYSKFEKIYIIFDKFMHINNHEITEILILLCRNFYPGPKLLNSFLIINNNSNENYFLTFLLFIKSKLNFIFDKNNYKINLPRIIFIKILRLLSETYMYNQMYNNNNNSQINDLNNSNKKEEILRTYEKLNFNDVIKKNITNIIDNEIYILTKIYQNSKENIYQIGRELIRLLAQLGNSNIDIINTIIKDINNNLDIYNLLTIPYEKNGINLYAKINIPPLMERMIIFLLSNVKKSSFTFSFYLNWIYHEFNMETILGNTLLVDIVRYIITCYNFYTINNNNNDKIPKYMILCYILKNSINQLLSSEIKQAMYLDLILFNKNKDEFLLIEPSISSIIINLIEYPKISEELIEFLDLYVHNFDKNNISNGLQSIYEGIKIIGEKYNISNINKVINESKIEEKFKIIFLDMVNLGENNKNIEININLSNENNYLNNNTIIEIENDLKVLNDNKIIDNFNDISPSISNDDSCTKHSVNTRSIQKDFSQNILISKELYMALSDIILNTFISNRNETNFKNLLIELCKLINWDSKYQKLIEDFAYYFIDIFKDELEFQNFNNFEEKDNSKYVYICLFDFAYENQNNGKIFFLMVLLINKILEIYPKFIIHLIYFILENSINQKNYVEFFYKLNGVTPKLIKEKLKLFFEECDENCLLNFLKYFFTNDGVALFKQMFYDDTTLIYKIIMYCDIYSINVINMSLMTDNYIIIDKCFSDLFRYSLNFSFKEKNIFWNIVFAQKNIPSLKLNDFLLLAIELSNELFSKYNKKALNPKEFDEFFLRIINSINYLFFKKINDEIKKNGMLSENIIDAILLIFNFDCNFKSYIYKIIICFVKKYNYDIKSRSEMLNLSITKFISLHNNDKEKMKKFYRIIKFICINQENAIVRKYNNSGVSNANNNNETEKEDNDCLLFFDRKKGIKDMMNKINEFEN